LFLGADGRDAVPTIFPYAFFLRVDTDTQNFGRNVLVLLNQEKWRQ